MKKCPDCGLQVSDDTVKFCPECACRLERVDTTPSYSSGSYSSGYSRSSPVKIVMIILGIAAVLGLIIFGIVKIVDATKVPDGSEAFSVPEYEIGDRGEAGVVFYDKGYYSDGWRYLEVAKNAIRKQGWDEENHYDYINLSQDIGSGDFNTYLIINNYGTDTAAYVAKTYNGEGKKDWYLGNIKEMQLLFENLVKDKGNRKKVDSYSDVVTLYTTLSTAMKGEKTWTYLTSNMADEENCYIVYFSTAMGYKGGETSPIGKDWRGFTNKYDLSHDVLIRPIRKF